MTDYIPPRSELLEIIEIQEKQNKELTARIAELEANYKGAQAEIADAIGKAVKEHVARCNAENALTEARKDSAWQPIETAPKTAKAILVYCAERRNTYAVNYRHESWQYFGGSGTLTEEPTHWMPLPSPKETL